MTLFNKIFLADDDEEDIELMQSVINENCSHLHLTVAPDGEVLLQLLQATSKPDLILLNLKMPFKDGRECLTEIRSNSAFDNIPVAIYSTSSSQADIDYCLSRGANHYFVKPTSYAGLVSIVQGICNGKLIPFTQYMNYQNA
jgi:CheY-like chemotaxis protein